MEISHRTQDHILIVTPEEKRLDAIVAMSFKEKTIDLISNQAILKVIFDMHHLHTIDSAGIGSLLSVLKMINTKGGELKLAQMNHSIKTMFELGSLHKMFQICKSTEEAICSFNSKR